MANLGIRLPILPEGQGYPEATSSPPSTLCPTLGGPLEGPHLIHIISRLKNPVSDTSDAARGSLELRTSHRVQLTALGSCFMS